MSNQNDTEHTLTPLLYMNTLTDRNAGWDIVIKVLIFVGLNISSGNIPWVLLE